DQVTIKRRDGRSSKQLTVQFEHTLLELLEYADPEDFVRHRLCYNRASEQVDHAGILGERDKLVGIFNRLLREFAFFLVRDLVMVIAELVSSKLIIDLPPLILEVHHITSLILLMCSESDIYTMSNLLNRVVARLTLHDSSLLRASSEGISNRELKKEASKEIEINGCVLCSRQNLIPDTRSGLTVAFLDGNLEGAALMKRSSAALCSKLFDVVARSAGLACTGLPIVVAGHLILMKANMPGYSEYPLRSSLGIGALGGCLMAIPMMIFEWILKQIFPILSDPVEVIKKKAEKPDVESGTENIEEDEESTNWCRQGTLGLVVFIMTLAGLVGLGAGIGAIGSAILRATHHECLGVSQATRAGAVGIAVLGPGAIVVTLLL
ncbi:4222_t:CDS:2, partial [Acaulospora colombiana]